MLNFLPALILLIVQGSYGSEAAPRQLGLLMELASRSKSHAFQPLATKAETRELLKLLGQEEGRSLLSQAGLTVWGLALAAAMGDDVPNVPPSEAAEPERSEPILPAPSLGRLTDGHETCGRTRDGPRA